MLKDGSVSTSKVEITASTTRQVITFVLRCGGFQSLLIARDISIRFLKVKIFLNFVFKQF